MSTAVLYEVKDRVALVTLNLPEKRNPLNSTLCYELIAALRQAEASPDVTAILLAAAGDSFCAGGDLREFQQYRDKHAPDIYEEGKATAELFKTAGTLSKPIVAAVNGQAFGGGCGLVCACPIAVASDRARFGTTEVRLGLFPLVILPALRAKLGDRQTLEMGLTGQILDAHEAKAAGIVTRVVPHERLMEEAWATAAKIAAFSPIGIRLGLEAFRKTTDMEYTRAVDYLNTLRVVTFQTEDLHEGATAFLEKRAPRWTGR